MQLIALIAAWALAGTSSDLPAAATEEGAVLIQFVSARCPHCRAMQPVIQQLVQQGVRVEAVDVDRQSELAVQHRITAVPTFVAWRQGREVGRQVGVATASQLLGLWRAAEGPVPVEAASGQPAATRRAQAASVRLRVEDASGYSFGTGTIIDRHEQEALVITCGHLFRSSGGQGKITADLFVGPTRTVEGQLLAYDLERDVALLSLHGCPPVEPAVVAPPGHVVRPGDAVFSIGCDRGAEPTVRPSRITAVNKYRGKPNYTAAGQPVDGRSGGGLFTADGLLIGVCNAADPADDEGLYAALPSIQWQLDQVGLAEVYQRPSRPSAVAAAASLPEQRVAASESQVSIGGVAPVSNTPQTPGLDDEWELVVIVRSRRDPSRQSEVYVVDAVSGDLMHRITLAAQETGQRRAAQAARAATAVASASDREAARLRDVPVVRGQSSEQR